MLTIIVFFILLALKTAVDIGLDSLNAAYVQKRGNKVPDAFSDSIDQETYDKSVKYTLTKLRFGIIENVYDTALLAVIIASGLLPFLYVSFTEYFGVGIWGQSFVLFAIGMLLSVPSIPFEWWSQFRIEEAFGFNKSSLKLWICDKFKGTILGFVIGFPLLALLLWFFEVLPDTWWIWGFVCFFMFQILMMILYPMLIVPLFNKLSPLPEGELKDRLMSLGDRTGFKAKAIQVIDGSKRSSHSNAYFTGFGRFRRIVLYDTLIDQLEHEELEAVLAHEIGHYKLGHIPRMLIMAALFIFAGFWSIDFLSGQEWFYVDFGFDLNNEEKEMVPALLLFSILSGLVMFWISPLTNRMSRKHEYEADAFAKKVMGGSDPLKRSLRKLSEKNLSNFTPHPLYSAFHYSHPTLLEREAALDKA